MRQEVSGKKKQLVMSAKAMNYLLMLVVVVLLFASLYQTYVNWLQYSPYWYENGCPLHGKVCLLYPEKHD
jgi:hypothetical protein